MLLKLLEVLFNKFSFLRIHTHLLGSSSEYPTVKLNSPNLESPSIIVANLFINHLSYLYNSRKSVKPSYPQSSPDVVHLRARVGMVFQKPNPFPKSVYDNVAYGPRLQGIRRRSELDGIVEESLTRAALWTEVRDRLDSNALGLSGGQQQRLCLARALAVAPEILLMDEPTSALDPSATTRIEDLIGQLRGRYTIVIVTHNMQQAARVSDWTAFMYEGHLVEFGVTRDLFTNPANKQTEDYITGRFG